MSWVVRDNKGREVQVRLMDAFFGGRRTIRRPTAKAKANSKDRLPAENQASKTSAKDPTPATDEDKGDGKDDKNEGAKSGGKDESSDKKDEASGWTEEQDQELLKLKGDGKTWAQISETLGKPKKDLTQRFGELKKAESKAKKSAGEPEDKKETEFKKEAASAPKDANGHSTLEPDAEIDPVGTVRKRMHASEGGSEMQATFESIGSLSVEEIRLLAQLQDFYETQKWVAVSARFHSETGKHVDPTALKERWSRAPRI